MAGFTIPNEASAFAPRQASPDKVDMDIITLGYQGYGVYSGTAVSAQGSPNMTVAVASGTVIVAGVFAAVSAGNATITTADGTNPRVDLVVVNGSGTVSVVAGTPAAIPLMGAIPASSVVLASVYVPASVTSILSTYITDKRVMMNGMGPSIIVCTSSTRPASPIVGQQIYETNTGNTMVYQSATTTWTAPWSVSWGEVAYKEITANVTGFTTAASDVTGLTALSVTWVAHRVYRLEGHGIASRNTTAGGADKVYITDASNNTYGMVCDHIPWGIGARVAFDRSFTYKPSAGATVSLKARMQAGAGTVDWLAASGTQGSSGFIDIVPGFIRVVDEGPNGAPL